LLLPLLTKCEADEITNLSSGSLVFSNLPYMTLSVAFIQMLKVCGSKTKPENWGSNRRILLLTQWDRVLDQRPF
jgi:hypothetical protein